MKRIARTLIVAALAAGCGGPIGGTETGNPDAQVRVQMTAWSSNDEVASIPLSQALTTGVVITRALIGVEEIRLIRALADGTCPVLAVDDDGIEIERAFVADLLRPETLTPITVPKAAVFCGFRVGLEEGEDLPGGAVLGEAEILIEGTRSDGTPFELRSDGIGDIRVNRSSPFSFTQDDSLWFVAFDVASWFADVDLDAATPVGGTILIDEENNPAQLAQFEAVIEAAAGTCDDDDDDGALENACDDDD